MEPIGTYPTGSSGATTTAAALGSDLKMSDPFQDAPASPSDEKQRKFEEYKPQKLSWFINDDPNAEGWPTVESPTMAALTTATKVRAPREAQHRCLADT